MNAPDGRWACLMYHQINDSETDVPYYGVPRRRFAEQLDRLRSQGLTGRHLEALLGLARGVAITFDDGDDTHYANAFPELASRGMTATFFVITGRVGTSGYATWDQLREMAAAGMSIQSHSATHPLLSELTDAEAQRELATSRECLDDSLHQRTATIALPGGDMPRGGWPLIRAAGYRYVATSVWGPNAANGTPFIRRYTVRRDTPAARFDSCITTRSAATSPEGLRLAALSTMRRLLGASRYARWRRQVLSLLGR